MNTSEGTAMGKRIEDIISEYVDADINDQPLSAEKLVERVSDLSDEELTQLGMALTGYTMLRQLVEEEEHLSIEDKRKRSWERMQNRMKVERVVTTPVTPSVGTLLGRAWEQQPSLVSEFRIPSSVIMDMVEDGSPIDLVAENPDTRLRFAQRYATGNQQLLTPIIRLVNRLRSIWLSESQLAPGPVYGRPTPADNTSEESRSKS